jgi:hypothetical protein
MTSNEVLGVISTAGKLLVESSTALTERDWARFFELHEQAEKALLYVQLQCVDAQLRFRIQELFRILEERREIALSILEGNAIGEA